MYGDAEERDRLGCDDYGDYELCTTSGDGPATLGLNKAFASGVYLLLTGVLYRCMG